MHLVVIGGTAAGMSCAARARRLDENADITVLEKTDHVSSASCGLPYHLSGTIASRSALEVETPESLKASLNIDVRLGNEAIGIDPVARTVTVRTSDGTTDVPYDAAVIATGTRSATPPIPGLDSPGVTTLRTIEDAASIRSVLEDGNDDHRPRVVIIGAGFIGVEAAENMIAAHASVSIVDGGDHPLGFVDPDIASYATQSLQALGADVLMGTTVARITAADPSSDHTTPLRVTLSNGDPLDADLVLVATGVVPNSEAFAAAGIRTDRGWIDVDEHGATSLRNVWAAGDVTLRTDRVTGSRHPLALAGPSNREGRLVADAILDPDHARPFPPTLGTAIIRVGHSVIGATGANATTLTRAGIAFRTLHLQPSQHAGYYPGACEVDLRVHVAADGRILGAQAAGSEGVDKRIDVMATAITAGLTADDLIDLDLAYAPPFGSAKDPINFVGYMAQDLSQGKLTQTQATDLPDVIGSMMVLDVRTPREFEQWHLPQAINIPHTRIRDHIEDIRRRAGTRPVLLVCASGKRAYLAHRILDHHGIASSVLSGGMNTLGRYL